jgi:hypothetical protein
VTGWERDGSDPDAESWYLVHGQDVYSLHRRFKQPQVIVCTKNGFFSGRFVDRSMELAKEYAEKFIVDAPSEGGE